MKLFFVFVAFLLSPIFASAQALAIAEFAVSSVGNVSTVAAFNATAANAANLAFATAANGSVFTVGRAAIPIAGETALAVSVTGGVSGVEAAAILGRFLAGPVGVLVGSVALYKLAKEQGYELDLTGPVPRFGKAVAASLGPSAAGSGTGVPGSGSCCFVADVYAATRGYGATEIAALADAVAKFNKKQSEAATYQGTSQFFVMQLGAKLSAGSYSTPISYNTGASVGDPGGSVTGNPDLVPVTPGGGGVPQTAPVTVQEFLDSIATKSGWPATSNLAPAVKDAIVLGTEKPALIPQTIVGPLSRPGASSVTVNPSQGTQTTTTTTKQMSYTPTTVTVSEKSSSITINPSTGAVVAQTSTTTSPVTPASPEPVPDPCIANPDRLSCVNLGDAVDPDLPAKPILYTPKYPTGLEGVWTAQSAALKSSPVANLIGNLMPSIPSGGAYPSWPVAVEMMGHNFGTYDVSPPGYVWAFIRICVLITTAFLVRALIFGG